MKEVEAMSEKRVVLATGTLYSALRRMLEDDWIERVMDNNSETDNRERKLYQLTRNGRRVLEAEISRLRKLVDLTELHDVREGR
jgi:DNA-binding PadR family transcriptional regulator